uniref:Uncharacterized protein n=1 Tax=Brassica campestris TaxID=3711 RepID=A0A3P6B3K9_BRACM|nr:unnamed protein product [Brassica rapa]
MVDLGILTPVALTYQLPDWMLEPEGAKSPPITLLCDKDVEIMSTVSDYMYDPVLYVTSGPEQVAKYQFYCRSPFKIDETTYLKDGVTEEEHREAIRGSVNFPKHLIFINYIFNDISNNVFFLLILQDLVGGHPIVCSHHILELMYNEPQLLLVYRVALEIEMVYGVPNDHEETEDPAEFLNLTGEENMATDEGVSIHPLHPANDDPNIQDRVNDSVNVTNPATQDDVEPVSTLMIGDSSAAVGKEKTTSADEVVVATDPPVTPTNTEPCLDLTLGIGLEKKTTAAVPISGLDDASSEAEAGIGGFDPLF